MEQILKYFPDLSNLQRERFAALKALYEDWNAKINVISRKDMDCFYEHHVLHSLAIAATCGRSLEPGGQTILDVGTGGGFPGIPLAIALPHCRFRLIDGTGKKIRVAQEVIKATGLTNCEAVHRRGEEERGHYDFVVSRAVMPLPDLLKIVRKNIAKEQRNAAANGVICLKGGVLDDELRSFRRVAEVQEISTWFEEEWFKEKFVVYVPA